MDIEDLGYSSFFESNRNQLGLGGLAVARVIAEFKEAYRVKNTDGEYLAKITGKQMFTASSREDYPAVGDWVAITPLDDTHAVTQGVLPRRTIIKRKHGDKNRAGEQIQTQIIAANIDIAFVVESIDRDYSLNRFERYFALIRDGGVTPAIILNKVDLLSSRQLNEKLNELTGRLPAIDLIPTSTLNNQGLDELKMYIAAGTTYCFLGSSGRGRHITTARQMYFLQNRGIVIDNPGMREVGMADIAGGIAVLAQQCRYSDCTHTHEPGCAVIDAVKSGRLDEQKYSNYLSLKKEAGFYDMSSLEKREKDRKFGKFMKQAKKDLKDFRHKNY